MIPYPTYPGKPKLLSGILCLGVFAETNAKTPFEKAVQDNFSSTYVTAALLANSNDIRFGFFNFDPNGVTGLDNDNLGSEEAIDLRRRLKVYSLPYRISWQTEEGTGLWTEMQMTYMDTQSEYPLTGDQDLPDDELRERVYSLRGALFWRHPLGNGFHADIGAGLNLMRYENKTRYGSSESRALSPILDGAVLNVSQDAILGESVLGLLYRWNLGDGDWRVDSNWHYLNGQSRSDEDEAFDAHPEAWYLNTGVGASFPLDIESLPGQRWFYRLSRVDLGGDLHDALGNPHYYEGRLGWLFATPGFGNWIENLGISLNLNYGSYLKGGTIVLLINEE